MAVTTEHYRKTPGASGSCYQWNDRVITILYQVDLKDPNLRKKVKSVLELSGLASQRLSWSLQHEASKGIATHPLMKC